MDAKTFASFTRNLMTVSRRHRTFPADVTGFDILARAALRHAIHFGSNSIVLITVTITFASGQLPIAGTRMVNHWENLLYKPAVFIYYSRYL